MVKTRNKSITVQICITIIGLTAGTVLLCWLLNTLFLENYYSYRKMTQLSRAYLVAEDAAKENKLLSTEFSSQLENLGHAQNLTAIIISSDGKVVASSEPDANKAFGMFVELLVEGPDEKRGNPVIEENEKYSILELRDDRTGDNYLVLWGDLGNNNLLMIRTALESLRDSVEISNRFLLYAGLVAIFISIAAAIFITKRLTSPIVKLKDISIRMSELDFSARYESGGSKKDELDELGEHMNMLSDTLKETISELKTANNELLVDIEKKDKMEQMRGEFISNVSHELKTPLALISGYCEGLKECVNDDPESRDFYCDVILDETDKMTKMVQKLLTLNRLEFGGQKIELDRFNLSELIDSVVDANSLLAEKKGLKIERRYESDIFVWADEFEIEEVITNYISNAVNHVSGKLRIVVSIIDKENVQRVCVYNTGEHISESDLNRIWDKFYKVDKARSREYGGSGIGLSIVKAIMDNHHQMCGCENVEGGVEFWFELDKN